MESIPCDYCGAKESVALPHETKLLCLPQPYSVVRCASCGLMYMNPRMTEAEYRAFYSSKYYNDYDYSSILSEERNPKFTRRISQFNRLFPQRGRLLDIGTATGEFLDFARKSGWDVYGTEVSEYAAHEAQRKYGLNVFIGTAENAGFDDGFFDIVHLSHVLEHVPSPTATSALAYRLLKPGGIFVIEVPHQFGNWFDKTARLFGRQHPLKEASMHHVYFYTTRSLGLLLRKAGFSPTCKTYSLDTAYRNFPKTVKPLASLVSRCFDIAGGGLFIEAFAKKPQ